MRAREASLIHCLMTVGGSLRDPLDWGCVSNHLEQIIDNSALSFSGSISINHSHYLLQLHFTTAMLAHVKIQMFLFELIFCANFSFKSRVWYCYNNTNYLNFIINPNWDTILSDQNEGCPIFSSWTNSNCYVVLFPLEIASFCFVYTSRSISVATWTTCGIGKRKRTKVSWCCFSEF